MRKLSLILIFALMLSLFAGCKRSETTSPSSLRTSTDASVASAAPAESTDSSEPDTPVDPDSVHPMLFRVTGEGGQESYLFGTIHIGDSRIHTALEKLIPYLDSCDALAVEFDIVAFEKSPSADQIQALMPFLLTDGTKISDHMPEELYQRAYELLRKAKLSPGLMKSYRPAMWAQLVEQAALLTQSDYDLTIGMDRSLIQHCYEQNIEVRDVESAEFQYSMLAGFPDELNLLLIQQTLDHLEEYGSSLDKLYNAWAGGDPEEIAAVVNEEDEEEMAAFSEAELALLEEYNNQMLTQRNLGMRDRFTEWLKAGDKVFFAVGAAHLVNEDGLVALLQAEGYTVEQISY